jgi:predicted Zn finger-like uncharacterized protein
MALATRCPHCHTTFRVAQDQLKLRSGLVRCGACKQIFNGVEHLLQSERSSSDIAPPIADAPAPASPSAPQPIVAEPVVSPANRAEPPAPATTTHSEPTVQPKDDLVDFSEFLAPTSPSAPASPPEIPEPSPQGEAQEDPLQRMPLMNLDEAPLDEDHAPIKSERIEPSLSSAGEQTDSHADALEETPDPIEQAVDALLKKPPRAKTLAELRPGFRSSETQEEETEPDFVRKGRRKQRLGRVFRIAMGIGSVLLFAGLIAQAAYAFRNVIAAFYPATRPALTKACEILACHIRLPAQIDNITLESSDLQSLPDHANTLVLTMLLRNGSQIVQTWPYVELTLNDANDKPVARRILSPQDYLPSEVDAHKGFPRYSEQATKTLLQVSELKPEGYRLYLFYP